MRGNLVAQVARFGGFGLRLHLLEQMAQLMLQQIDLLLLPIDGAIQLLDHILGEVHLDFEFGQTIFHGVPGILLADKPAKVPIVMQATDLTG